RSRGALGIPYRRSAPLVASVAQHPAIIEHHLLKHRSRAHQALAFRNEVLLRHVEKIEVCGAGPKSSSRSMGVANPVINCLVMIRLYADRFGNAFSHEL